MISEVGTGPVLAGTASRFGDSMARNRPMKPPELELELLDVFVGLDVGTGEEACVGDCSVSDFLTKRAGVRVKIALEP